MNSPTYPTNTVSVPPLPFTPCDTPDPRSPSFSHLTLPPLSSSSQLHSHCWTTSNSPESCSNFFWSSIVDICVYVVSRSVQYLCLDWTAWRCDCLEFQQSSRPCIFGSEFIRVQKSPPSPTTPKLLEQPPKTKSIHNAGEYTEWKSRERHPQQLSVSSGSLSIVRWINPGGWMEGGEGN